VKTCLFGGTFDPPHIGHLLIAQTICEVEKFDKILFIPAYEPPHKKFTSLVEHRLNMLKIAIAGNPNFELCDLEIKRKGISYSVDTIKIVQEKYDLKKSELYYLMGTDSLGDFRDWHKAKEILNICQVIVAVRPGFSPSDIPPWIMKKIQFANIPRFEISSTTIRYRWIKNKTIRYMVPLDVWKYINENHLFQPATK
jgi:nicotinate-nucleotide adenylyltransferase